MTPTVLVNFLLEDDPRDFLNRTFSPHQIHHQLVTLAVEAAELVLPIFEREFPTDNRPRKAIEAAKAWLKNKSITADLIDASSAAHSVALYAANAAAFAGYAALYAARVSTRVAAAHNERNVVHAAFRAASDASDAASEASEPELIPALERIRDRVVWLGSISKP